MGEVRDVTNDASIPITMVEYVQDLEKKGRSNLAAAILEDESVRQRSEARCEHQMNKIDEKESEMSFGMWAVLWFTLGVLTCLSLLSSIPAIADFLYEKGVF